MLKNLRATSCLHLQVRRIKNAAQKCSFLQPLHLSLYLNPKFTYNNFLSDLFIFDYLLGNLRIINLYFQPIAKYFFPKFVKILLVFQNLAEIWRSMLTARFYYTYLLTSWCRVLEKLTGLQLVKKFPAFHGNRRFITALTSVRHLSLSWASLIQYIYPHPTSWRSILILSTHLRLRLPSGLLPSGFPRLYYTNIKN